MTFDPKKPEPAKKRVEQTDRPSLPEGFEYADFDEVLRLLEATREQHQPVLDYLKDK